MKYALPIPIDSGFKYDSVLIDNVKYDGSKYTADVFGVVNGEPLPFIFQTPAGLHRVTNCIITDAEIDAVLAEHPGLTVRLDAGIHLAMERLYALIGAQPNA
ncbi:MAG: hypothetical protein WCS52_02340 [bacterium]